MQLQKEIHYVDSMKLKQRKRVVILDVNEGDIFGEECLNDCEEHPDGQKSSSATRGKESPKQPICTKSNYTVNVVSLEGATFYYAETKHIKKHFPHIIPELKRISREKRLFLQNMEKNQIRTKQHWNISYSKQVNSQSRMEDSKLHSTKRKINYSDVSSHET